MLKERREYLNTLRAHKVLEAWTIGIYAVIGFWSLFKTESLSAESQDQFQLVHMIPALSLQGWATLSALLLAFWIFEASFRGQRKMNIALSDLQTKLNAYAEVLRPKLRIAFSKDIPGCRVPTKITISQYAGMGATILQTQMPCIYYRMEIRADCIGSVPQCTARITWIKKEAEIIFSGEQLVMPFAPAESPTSDIKDVLDKLPSYLDVLALTEQNKVLVTTKGFVTPNSHDFQTMFNEPASYTFHIVFAAPNQPSIEKDLILTWTGDWKTATVN